MFNLFRKIAFLEGISLILLIFAAMPLKYIFDMPIYNQIIGMAHGILFIVYVILAVMATKEKNWGTPLLIFCLVASIIPFGTFYLESKMLRKFR